MERWEAAKSGAGVPGHHSRTRTWRGLDARSEGRQPKAPQALLASGLVQSFSGGFAGVVFKHHSQGPTLICCCALSGRI